MFSKRLEILSFSEPGLWRSKVGGGGGQEEAFRGPTPPSLSLMAAKVVNFTVGLGHDALVMRRYSPGSSIQSNSQSSLMGRTRAANLPPAPPPSVSPCSDLPEVAPPQDLGKTQGL